MKIASSTVEMSSSHTSAQKYELNEKLRSWIGNQRPDFEGTSRLIQQPSLPSTAVQISEAGISAQSNEATAIQDSMNAVENDPIMRMIRAMIAALTGREVKVFDAGELQSNAPAFKIQDPNQVAQTTQPQSPQQPAGFGIEYDRHESYSEFEQTNFQTSGVIQTTDGREIAFSLAISMSRSYLEESDISIRLGDARKKQDPLVINFNGTATQLTNQRFKFDLNSDGQNENINFATNGSGFLALDRNNDGKINNGSELFGANSGNGFADLSLLDTDHNGWIDENDSAYGQLRILTKNAAGNDQLSTLKQTNIGALSISAIETSFELKEPNNTLLGQIKNSGIFLRDDGSAGTIQQVDLTV